MAAPKKKRKMSAAQKAALAKGRKALAARRGKKKTAKPKAKAKKTTARKTVKRKTVSKGSPMATKKKARKRSTGGGVRGRARRTVRRARSFMSKTGAMGVMKDAALAVGGGIAAGVLANKLPIADPRLKAGAPIAAGVVLAATIGRKNEMAKGFATGMVVLGAVALLKQLAPNVPMLAGEEEMVYVPQYPSSVPGLDGEMLELGYDDEDDLAAMGENVDLGEEYYSPADL